MSRRPVLRSAALAAVMAAAGFGLAGAQTTPDTPPAAAAPPPESAAPPQEPAPPPETPKPPKPARSSTPDSSDSSAPASSSDAPKSSAPRTPPPPKKTLYTAAVLQALDKVTADTLRFEAPLNKPIRYKGLIFIVHSCELKQAESGTTTAAHLEIDSQPLPQPGHEAPAAKVVYRGWMFADAPGLHPLEHPVYDAWLIACKTAAKP